jgi:hypothetical protein
MVGAGRFERPTPCAQGSFRHRSETACFQLLPFQADGASLLQLVELRGIRGLPQLHFYLHSSKNEDATD